MNIWEIDKLLLFLFFFIPGFISLKVYDFLIPREPRDFSKNWFDAMAYSALNYAVLSWPILYIHSGNFFIKYPLFYAVAAFLILVVIPAVWPILFLKTMQWDRISKYIVHPVLKPWDYFFKKKVGYWVIASLKDGRRIGGVYGTKSFTSSYPAEEQIYLEQAWKLDDDGRFIEVIDRTQGIILFGREMVAIEFYIMEEGKPDVGHGT